MTDHLFLINPAAGKTDRTQAISKAVAAIGDLASGNIELYTTQSPGDGTRYVCNRLRETQTPMRIYACGGDGTLNEAAQGIYLSGSRTAALGVIPTGSGNDFIRSFPIPESRFRAVRSMIAGKEVPCDLILVTDDDGAERVCVNLASAGFDAAVCRGKEQFQRLPLISGSMAYNLSLVQQFTRHLGHTYTVLADGKPIETAPSQEYLFAIGANGRYYGGGFQPSPNSKTDDGMMNMILFKLVSRLEFIRLAKAFHKGDYFTQAGSHVIHRQVQTMQILSDTPVTMNLDGEMVPLRNPHLQILPGALRLILPAE